MGTKNNPGEYDCYANAEPDEPMFILLARDPDAPALVRQWAKARWDRGERQEKIAEADACAKAMEDWRNDPANAKDMREKRRLMGALPATGKDLQAMHIAAEAIEMLNREFKAEQITLEARYAALRWMESIAAAECKKVPTHANTTVLRDVPGQAVRAGDF